MKKNLSHNISYLVLTIFLLTIPSFVSAQNQINTLITSAKTWLGLLVYIAIGIAVVLFFWGIIKYVVAGAGNEEGKQQARNLIVYGIVGLFVMVSIWGLVYFLSATLGIGIGGTPPIPQLPGGGLAPAAGGSALIAIITKIGGWISSIVTLLIGLALVLFLWGIARYIASGADEERRTEARRLIVYGVIGLFSMVAIWGLVYFVGAPLGVGIGGGVTPPPQITSIDLGNIGANGTNVTITGTAMTTCDDWATTKSFKAFVCLVLKILKPIPPILIALAVLYFFWGIAKYMNSGGDAEKLQNGRITIIYGILGMFVLIAVWGLVYLIQGELGLG